MTLDQLITKINNWDLEDTGSPQATSQYGRILNQLQYHAKNEWRTYLPATHPDFEPSYMDRLASWIGNLADEEDQKLLLEYALQISFFSHEDFAALYRTAFDREVTRWIATQAGMKIEGSSIIAFQEEVAQHINRETWFCPITDSMDINEFYKVNHLTGIGHRPGFATLQMLAERAGTPNLALAQNITFYMENPSLNPDSPSPSIKWIVLLEDIVGSGSQCLDAVKWAVANLGKPVLFVPLILCPNGEVALHVEEHHSKGRLTVRPVIKLRRSDLLGPERQGQPGWENADKLEDLANRCAHRANGPYDTFGYNKTGCSLVTFANTPDNTLPIVHNKPSTGNWAPLFPRVYRD